jgi:LPS-assembly lipoprotein
MSMRRALLVLMLCLALPACGFRPMYGAASTPGSPAVMEKLASVDVRPIPDRLGQVVRNELIEAINPAGAPANPAYELALLVGEEREDVGLRENASSTRANYRMSARFELRETATDKVVLQGTTWAETAFDIVQQDYPTVIAQQDAQQRLAVDLAEEIRTRLAVFFDRGR